MYHGKDEGEKYIAAIPRLGKWINECVICHQKGYKPDMPKVIAANGFSLDGYFIRKYFKPLEVNEDGVCRHCSGLLNKDISKK